jgi:single-stranded-DNA-specific exonuclease
MAVGIRTPDETMAAGIRTPDEIIDLLLAERGIADRAEFFSARPQLTYDPFLLPGMADAVDLIHKHIEGGGRICVYGDYDVDGLMSVTLLTEFLAALPGAAPDLVSWYIPSRFDEGYGLNVAALERIRRGGADLVVTVDCGVAYADEVAAAMEMGLDVVVTDHHEPDAARLPDCPSVDPKIPGSLYPFDGLCGCGVAFKVAQALKSRYHAGDPRAAAALNGTLDLVAVATIADVMPLLDENRTFVKYGLRALNAGSRWQLRALAEGIGLNAGAISAHDVSFGIAPHLNAAGRMGDAARAAELLKTEDRAAAAQAVADLVAANTERRREQDEAYAACCDIIDAGQAGDGFLLVRPPRVHEGVSGIVAGKLREKYGRPAAVLAEVTDEGTAMLKGSARSIPGVDVISLLRSHAELFTRLGGHAMAAGFTIPIENETALRDAASADVAALAVADPNLLSPLPSFDLDIVPAEATLELAADLGGFEPTGTGNPRPSFRISGVAPDGIRRLGADGRHLKFQADGLEYVYFVRADEVAELPAGGGPYDVFGSLDVNSWNGRDSVQFKVRAVRGTE